VRALSCLAAINRLRERQNLSLDDIFRETIRILKAIGFEGDGAKVSILFDGRHFGDRSDAEIGIESEVETDDGQQGHLAITWPTDFIHHGKYLENAGELVDTVARRIGMIISHENARTELERHRAGLEALVRERTEELVVVNRRLREEIDERAKIETALRESERQYRILFENANEAIFIAREGRIHFPNPMLSTLSGFTRDQLLDSLFRNLIHLDDADMVTALYQQRLAGAVVPNAYPFRLVTAKGAVLWVEISSVLTQWQGQPATINFLRDITARKKIEATVGQIQKMEAIGALAGGIAHQFNNKLSSIIGNIDLLRFSLPDRPQVRRYCDTMLKSADAMAELTQQLLAYARGGRYQVKRQALQQLVLDAAHLIGDTGDRRITIETRFAMDTPEIEGDRVQLAMVLREVIGNAAEAIGGNGTICIHTHRIRFDEVAAEAFYGMSAGEYAGLCISDNGSGMSDEACRKIFDPFFTTKFLGRGMGMAAAYGIIKNHEGFIYVDSEVGIGTVVHIFLPCAGSFPGPF